MIFSRQNLPIIDREIFADAVLLQKGAYVLADLGDGDPRLILMASGYEVALIVESGTELAAIGISVRLVSFPSWEFFQMQPKEYRERVLPRAIRARLAVEAGVSMGWDRCVGDHGAVIGLEQYGASAPAGVLFKESGFTTEAIFEKAKKLLEDSSAISWDK